MKVVFWSNQAGHCATTSSLLAIMCSIALTYKVRGVALPLSYKGNNFNTAVSGISNLGNAEYFNDIGMDYLIRNIKAGNTTDDVISDCGFSLLNQKFTLVPPTSKKNKELYEQDLKQCIEKLMDTVSSHFDITFIDAEAGSHSLSALALQGADLVVVCLNQEVWLQKNFFENYSFEPSKLFFLLGNYDLKQKSSLKQVMSKNKKFMNSKNTGIIPRCSEYADALNEGNLIKYFLKNINCGKNDQNYQFIQETSKVSKKLLVKLGMFKRDTEDDE